MANRIPIAEGEWYHCYNKGIDGKKTFVSTHDYERFLMLLYICNTRRSPALSDRRRPRLHPLLTDAKLSRKNPLVDIGAYCLMPNRVHLVIKEIEPRGISAFMQKVFTGYTMYFNTRHERVGALFSGSFKSRHLSTDRYFKHAINYIHMNPVELFEPGWKDGVGNIGRIEEKLKVYRYSSMLDHTNTALRPESKILGPEAFTLFHPPTSLSTMLFEAQAYYRTLI